MASPSDVDIVDTQEQVEMAEKFWENARERDVVPVKGSLAKKIHIEEKVAKLAHHIRYCQIGIRQSL